MPLPTATITLGDLQTFVKRQFGDESGVQITDSDITRWLNMGAMEIASKNKLIQATATTPGVAGQRDYDISDLTPGLISIAEVSYSGISLTQVDNSEVKKLLPYGTDAIYGDEGAATIPVGSLESGAPVYWYSWGNNIKLWPVPTADGVFSIDYVKTPIRVTSAGQPLPLPDIYFERLCNFVLSKAYELDEDMVASDNQRKLFEDKLTEMTGMEDTRAGSFAVVRDDFNSGYYSSPEWWY